MVYVILCTFAINKRKSGVRKGKSYGDILEQAERLANSPRATSRRIDVVNIAADRYTDRIMRLKSFKQGGVEAYNKKYSRKTYMGLSNG